MEFGRVLSYPFLDQLFSFYSSFELILLSYVLNNLQFIYQHFICLFFNISLLFPRFSSLLKVDKFSSFQTKLQQRGILKITFFAFEATFIYLF